MRRRRTITSSSTEYIKNGERLSTKAKGSSPRCMVSARFSHETITVESMISFCFEYGSNYWVSLMWRGPRGPRGRTPKTTATRRATETNKKLCVTHNASLVSFWPERLPPEKRIFRAAPPPKKSEYTYEY